MNRFFRKTSPLIHRYHCIGCNFPAWGVCVANLLKRMVLMTLKRRHKYVLIALALYWPAIFIATHIPVPDLVRQSGLSDKTMHLVTYMILTFLLWFALEPYQKIDWRYIKPWGMGMGIAAYGLMDEWLQLFVGRGADIYDFIANMIGMLITMVLLTLLDFWIALLVITGLVIFTLTTLSSASMILTNIVINTLFHFGAYAFFTLNWIHILSRISRLHGPVKYVLELALPFALLLGVKLVSMQTGKEIFWVDIYTAAAGIISSFIVGHLILTHPGVRKMSRFGRTANS